MDSVYVIKYTNQEAPEENDIFDFYFKEILSAKQYLITYIKDNYSSHQEDLNYFFPRGWEYFPNFDETIKSLFGQRSLTLEEKREVLEKVVDDILSDEDMITLGLVAYEIQKLEHK